VDSHRPLISIVAPVFNEAATLAEFVRRLGAVCAGFQSRYRVEIVLVDDGSKDDSLAVAKRLIETEPRLRVIELRRNFGQTAALQAGLSCARGDFIISLDSDLQHFPEDIPKFLDLAEQGYDLVCGWRKDRRENALRRWPSRAANALIRRVIGVDLHDFGTTFRLYRADLMSHIKLIGEEHRLVPALAHLVGASITEVPIQNVGRASRITVSAAPSGSLWTSCSSTFRGSIWPVHCACSARCRRYCLPPVRRSAPCC
jgi:glycosyltransferase involved in cell wall biosynthesis